jgi:hydroxymethylpyrimidine/phosphomethylpyrimidine kinase
MCAMTAIALTIAGSDSSGGAGIQADLKTFAALGVYGASVVTALTAQNTQGVDGVHNVPADFVLAQIRAVARDLDVRAIKIGMLGTSAIIETVAQGLEDFAGVAVVLDPVMVAASDDALLDHDAVETLRSVLVPRATLITPNLAESAKILDETQARDEHEMEMQARKIRAQGAGAALVKGGHAKSDEAVDILADDQGVLRVAAPRVPTRNTHGTGCTLSSAIAAELAKGADLREAVTRAKAYLTASLQHADELRIGKGRGPVHHFHKWWPANSRR